MITRAIKAHSGGLACGATRAHWCIMGEMAPGCIFCQIASGQLPAPIVFEDDRSIAFLDHRPLFPGHCLLIPRQHYETLTDLPADGVEPLFAVARTLCRAVEDALG